MLVGKRNRNFLSNGFFCRQFLPMFHGADHLKHEIFFMINSW
jgi:hypothetical protein